MSSYIYGTFTLWVLSNIVIVGLICDTDWNLKIIGFILLCAELYYCLKLLNKN